jgi:hypothetical protein
MKNMPLSCGCVMRWAYGKERLGRLRLNELKGSLAILQLTGMSPSLQTEQVPARVSALLVSIRLRYIHLLVIMGWADTLGIAVSIRE